MDYTVSRLARMAGVTPKTLRHYQEVGLLQPCRITAKGYRIYGSKEADRLQQILLYRTMGLSLAEIREILEAAGFSPLEALKEHRRRIEKEQERLGLLLATVEESIASLEGGKRMKDEEKFAGLKEEQIQENREKYGEEVREKYGEEALAASEEKLRGMTREAFQKGEALGQEILSKLKEAVEVGDPEGPLAEELCRLHKEWLMLYWGSYSKEAHKGLGEMYVADPRFQAYYDKAVPGGAAFLRDALNSYLS